MIPMLVTTHRRITDKEEKKVVKAFDLEICFVAKEAGLQLGQQSAFR